MKWLFRSFVFIAAFILSVFAYAITLPNGLSHCVVEIPHEQASQYDWADLAPRPRGIEVLYAGERKDGAAPMLRFVIVNGSDQQITYSSQIPTNPTAMLTANGKELPTPIGCGNGYETYYISPGGSAEVHVYAGQFLERPPKSADITVGFDLRSESTNTYEVYTSEKFRLPEEFRTAMNPWEREGKLPR